MKENTYIADHLYVTRKLLELERSYPFLKADRLGQSVAGREITALTFGKAEQYVLFAGAFHGAEWLTAALLLEFAKELAAAVAENGQIAGVPARRALSGRGLILVPAVNPDGCEISIHGAGGAGHYAASVYRVSGGDYTHYSANARGVDINHNFDAGWEALHRLEQKAGIYGPAPRRYGGRRPESEPETRAITTLCRTQNILHALAFHAQGEVIYWDFGEQTPPKSQKLAEILASSSGYALEAPEGLAVGGGFKDWFIQNFSRPAFTIEIGRGKNPLPPETLPEIYSRLREMMMFALML